MVVIQKGPTCGIYAFLNGIKALFSLEELTSIEMDKIVLMLLKNNERTYENKEERGKTFVGEFFTTEDYLLFLKNNYKCVIKEIENITNKQIFFKIEEYSISNLKNSTNTLFICPILPKKLNFVQNLTFPWTKKDKNKRVLHWISFLSKADAEYNVMDSRYKNERQMGIEEILSQHNDLKGGKYYWSKFNRKSKGKDPINKYLCYKNRQKNCFIEWNVLKDVEYQTGKLILIKKYD